MHKCKKCTVEKREKTMMERYGVAHALQNKELKKKKEDVCEEKYGNKVPSVTEKMKEKIKESNLKNME